MNTIYSNEYLVMFTGDDQFITSLFTRNPPTSRYFCNKLRKQINTLRYSNEWSVLRTANDLNVCLPRVVFELATNVVLMKCYVIHKWTNHKKANKYVKLLVGTLTHFFHLLILMSYRVIKKRYIEMLCLTTFFNKIDVKKIALSSTLTRED